MIKVSAVASPGVASDRGNANHERTFQLRGVGRVEAQVFAAIALDHSRGGAFVVERQERGDGTVLAGHLDAQVEAVFTAGIAARLVTGDRALSQHFVSLIVQDGLVEESPDGDEGVGTGVLVDAPLGEPSGFSCFGVTQAVGVVGDEDAVTGEVGQVFAAQNAVYSHSA